MSAAALTTPSATIGNKPRAPRQRQAVGDVARHFLVEGAQSVPDEVFKIPLQLGIVVEVFARRRSRPAGSDQVGGVKRMGDEWTRSAPEGRGGAPPGFQLCEPDELDAMITSGGRSTVSCHLELY